MTEQQPRPRPSQGDERKRRIVIIVDRDGAHLYYMSMLLQRLDYTIQTTKQAEDVVEIIDVARPDLIITEIALEGMDGIELLRKIKRNPRTYAIPMIVLTSSKDPAIKTACIEEGCKAYLQKPVNTDVLYAEIQRVTESRPRKYIRLNTCLNVMVGDDKTAELSVIEDYVTALSENGMFISTSKPRTSGSDITITLFVEDTKIRVDARVLYSFAQGEGPLRTSGMGVQFSSISPDDQAVIRSFIKKTITEGLTMGQIGGTIL